MGVKTLIVIHSLMLYLTLDYDIIDLQVPQQSPCWSSLHWSAPPAGGAQDPDVGLPAGPPRPAHQDEPPDDRGLLGPRPAPRQDDLQRLLGRGGR